MREKYDILFEDDYLNYSSLKSSRLEVIVNIITRYKRRYILSRNIDYEIDEEIIDIYLQLFQVQDDRKDEAD